MKHLNHTVPPCRLRLGLLLALLSAAGPSSARPRVVQTRLSLAPSKLNLSRVALAGFGRNLTPGQPALPEREVVVALHPRADLSSLRVEETSGPAETLPGRHVLPPNAPLQVLFRGAVRTEWGGAKAIVNGRDRAAYGRAVFPSRVIARVGVSNRRGLLGLRLRYSPLRYRHASAELLLERSTRVSISYRISDDRPLAPDAQLRPFLEQVENRAEARAWYQTPAMDTGAAPGYAIVIPDALRQQSTKLADFVAHKESLGFEVTVVKDSDLAAVSVGPQGGDAERIRGWLQQTYKQLNLRYVLLIGNPDPSRPGVPMKMTHATVHQPTDNYIPAPSDYYYADLTGNWDLNGNGLAGEYPEDEGPTGVDFAAEVMVGRIPIYDSNAKILDKILAKTMAYVTDPGDRSWRQRVLQPAAMLFFENQYHQHGFRMDGADVADPIFAQSISAHGFTRVTLYEAEGLDPSKSRSDLPLTRESVIAEWRKGYGLVTMVGHGSPQGIYRLIWSSDNGDGWPSYQEISSPPFLSYDDVNQLDDTRPSFVFHNSCSNGTPEEPDNLGYGLLRNGAIGTVSSSRVAFVVLDSSIFNLARDAVAQLTDGKPAGEALFIAKEQLSDKMGDISWFTRMEANLYGDPSLSLAACSTNAQCDDGRVCNGKEKCMAGQCVSAKPVVCTSTDPCTELSCEEPSGRCVPSKRPDGEPCDDLRFCTMDEVCQAGKCVGQPRCAAPGNPCVSASCDEVRRTCGMATISEGQVCHEDTDREGVCRVGICEPSASGCAVPAAAAARPGALLLLPIGLGVALWAAARRRRRR